jgi:hypothetical protein
MIFVALVVVSTAGIVSIYIQCRNLYRTRHKKEVETDNIMSSEDVREVQTALRGANKQSKETLAAEVESMRTIQREVKAKLAGLEQMVQNYTEMQEQKEQQHQQQQLQLGKKQQHTAQEEDYRPKKE